MSEINNFLSRKSWIQMKIITAKPKGRNPVPVQYVLKSKEEHDGSIRLNSINVVKGYMQFPEDDYTESIFPVATYTQAHILL